MALPFNIDSHGRSSLTDQVADGLRRAIQAGHYKSGNTLPTIQETARALGISVNVVRTAVRRLVREGLVTARPRRGIEVCPANVRPWLAHVLYLHWGSANSYYEAVSSEALMRTLLARRILVSSVHLNQAEVAEGYPMVNAVLRAGPVHLAVVAGGAEGIGVLLAENDIPFVHVDSAGVPFSRLARRLFLTDSTPTMEQVVEHACACRVQSLLVVTTAGSPALVKRAEAAGIVVRVLEVTPCAGMGSPESMERGGLEAMARHLDAGTPLPDLILFMDDFLARGGLTALLARSIRIPEQVQVITWANRSLGPVFPKPMTRVEMDPVRTGESLAELVLTTLRHPHKKILTPEVLCPRFIVGETTVPR